jgi:NhaP-type Na+/H+ or K+/H+ antiporter
MASQSYIEHVSINDVNAWNLAMTLLWCGFWGLVGIITALTPSEDTSVYAMIIGYIIVMAFAVGLPVCSGILTAGIAKKKKMNTNIAYFNGFMLPVLGIVIFALADVPEEKGEQPQES